MSRAAAFPGEPRRPASAQSGLQERLPAGSVRPRAVLAADGHSVITGPIVTVVGRAGSLDEDLRALSVVKPRRILRRAEPRTAKRRPARISTGLDPLTQAFASLPNLASPLLDFAGMDFNTWGAGWPPDTNGDVGPDHYIQTVNTSIEIFNKNGTTATGTGNPITFDSFFASGGALEPCASNNMGDPVVLYDRVSGRWIITDFAWVGSSGPYYECIAVSKSADPVSGGWWLYAFQTHASYVADYPKLGVWPDAVYMSANLFDSANVLHGTRVWAFNRGDLISGNALRTVAFDLSSDAGLLPANYTGALPPAGSPNVFADLEPTLIHLWRFHVDWANTANSTFSGPVSVPIGGYNMPGSIPQPVSQTLDTLSDRLMMQAQYRRIGGTESLWLNHTVASGGIAGIRWYEVRSPNGTPSLYQQSTFQPDSTHRWMGSLAVDGYGNMALGYSASSSSVYPSIRYTGRAAGDLLNTLQSEMSVIAGSGAQMPGRSGFSSLNRWGDYSSMSVDPVDDCTFWYTTEYYQTTATAAQYPNWLTRIATFSFPGCGGSPTVDTVVPASGSTGGGTAITVSGAHFVAGATTVTVGGNPAVNVTVNSSTSLTATTPAGAAGAATVTVATAAGNGLLGGGFTYVGSGTAPTVTAVTPASGPSAGGTMVTVTGTNFVVGSTTVTVGSQPATSVLVGSKSSLTALTPAGGVGFADVAVTTPNGTGSLANAFTYTPSALPPTLTSVSPSAGPTTGGTTITLTGSNFAPGQTTVAIGGIPVRTLSVASATSLSALTPVCARVDADPDTLPVTVFTPAGKATLAGAFTCTPPPSVVSADPVVGSPFGGTLVTLTGTRFVAGGTTVLFGGIAATNVSVTSSTSLVAVTPAPRAGTTAVDVTVITPGGSATLTGGFSYSTLAYYVPADQPPPFTLFDGRSPVVARCSTTRCGACVSAVLLVADPEKTMSSLVGTRGDR